MRIPVGLELVTVFNESIILALLTRLDLLWSYQPLVTSFFIHRF